jgi:hypothetical protein
VDASDDEDPYRRAGIASLEGADRPVLDRLAERLAPVDDRSRVSRRSDGDDRREDRDGNGGDRIALVASLRSRRRYRAEVG